MLKYKLDSLEGLDESIAGLYETSGDKFILKVEGIAKDDDLAGLKRQVETLMSEKKEASKKAKEAEEIAEAARMEAAKKSGDTEALEKSWQEKLDATIAAHQQELQSMQGAVNTMTVDNVAVSMANEIGIQGSADILIPHIKSRLAAEQRDGQFVTVIRDKDGKPSASSVDDLKNEFINNPAFAPVIVGSKASGGGANGGGKGGGVAKTLTRSQFDDLGPEQKAAHAQDGGLITD